MPIDRPVSDKSPNIEPTKDEEQPIAPKEEGPSMPRIDEQTKDVAGDFFFGMTELFEKPPELKEEVQYTRYDPTSVVSSRFADKVVVNLGSSPTSDETVGVLSKNEEGKFVLSKMKNSDDVEVNKKVKEGDVIFKHVGNAVRLIMSEKLREKLGKEGVEKYKQEVKQLLAELGLPEVPIQAIEVITLKTEDWETKVPSFFTNLQSAFLAQQKASQQLAASSATQESNTDAHESAKTQKALAVPTKERKEEVKREETPQEFPQTTEKKIGILEERNRLHDKKAAEEGKALDADLIRWHEGESRKAEERERGMKGQ